MSKSERRSYGKRGRGLGKASAVLWWPLFLVCTWCFLLWKPGPPLFTHQIISPIIRYFHHSGKLSHCTSWFLSDQNNLENVSTGAMYSSRKFSPGNKTSPFLQLKTPGIVEPTPAPHNSGSALLTGGDSALPVPVCLAWHKPDRRGGRIRNQRSWC